MLVDNQLYSVAEHHVLALDQDRGKTGFGWFLARRMTMAGEMAYMANGKEIIAVDHAKRAEATRKRHPLDLQMNKLICRRSSGTRRRLVGGRLKEAEAELEARQGGSRRGSPAKPDPPIARSTPRRRKRSARAEAAHQAAAAKYEPQRADFDKLLAKRDALKARIDELKQVGDQVAAFLAARVGAGPGRQCAGGRRQGRGGGARQRDRAKRSGARRSRAKRAAWRSSDGRLVVSTTEGKVYCFATAGRGEADRCGGRGGAVSGRMR